jgi:hypothetical protein
MMVMVCLPALLAPLQCFAATVNSAAEISLEESQNEFSLSVAVEQPEAYAGAEFALGCGEGVEVKSVSYSEDGMSAGPTEARGLTWFSFFSDENEYAGTVTADVRLAYSGEEDSYVEIDRVKLYTIEGGSVSTAVNSVGRRIPITRADAVVVAPPEEPEAELPEEETPLSDVPVPPQPVKTEASPETPDEAAEVADSGAERDAESLELKSISEEETPLTNDIQSEGDNRLYSGILLALFLASLMVNLLLGYLIIKRRRHSDEASA